jgi:RIO-like serine/threonine protein kinase
VSETLLKRGRLARTEIVTFRGRKAVRKTLSMIWQIPLFSPQFERWVIWREYRQLKRAEGIPGVPRILARPAPNVYLREYIEGVALPFAPDPPLAFFRQLQETVRQLHERGIVHNDLHKQANVIVKPDGTPGLLDFQLAGSLPKDSALFRLLVRFDDYHVVKNMKRRTGCELTPAEQELFDSTRALRRLMKATLKKSMNTLTRKIFPRALAKLPTDTDP